MPVLRSREIPSFQSSSSQKTPELGFIQPKTPSKNSEFMGNHLPSSPNSTDFDANSTPADASTVRRSRRLASKLNSDENSRNSSSPGSGAKRRKNDVVVESSNDVESEELSGLVDEGSFRVSDSSKMTSSDCLEEMKEENLYLSLRSGTKLEKRLSEESENDARKKKGKGILIQENDDENERNLELEKDGSIEIRNDEELKSPKRRRFTSEEKGKGLLSNFDSNLGGIDLNLGLNFGFDLNEKQNENENEDEFFNHHHVGLSEVEKEIYEGVNYLRNRVIEEENEVFEGFNYLRNGGIEEEIEVDEGFDYVQNEVIEEGNDVIEVLDDPPQGFFAERRMRLIKEQYKRIAKENALKYAHYDAKEDERNRVDSEDEDEDELHQEQPAGNVEDWPGPFSTALKIIRDREKKLNAQAKNSSSGKGEFPLISWQPKVEKSSEFWKRTAPSLQILCLDILSKNVDAISSLYCVPDALRNRLTRLLCDSRQMNPHFLDLLLEGTPAEIRLSDCSWMEERVFEKSFEACDTSNLTVLQLDLCGHCVSDASLKKALVSKNLPALTSISLKGACRLSDAGLATLISSAPALRSLDLSDCSLLTDVGIDSIANSFGSNLHELYLKNCSNLDTKRILPMFKRMTSLEVLSLEGMVSVSDKFIREFISTNGQNMKELKLAGCVKLTDSSMKVIAEKCSQLRALDLSHLGRLTDIGMAYLTNGCRGLEDLNLRRCSFSDDAVAAFLEASGEVLKELSLNYVSKVSQNTTLSLARRCKNLEILDLSWCRRLTDEALGLIADSCLSLKSLKLFGCTQVSKIFVDGHSNPQLHIVGLKLTPILEHIKRPEFEQGPSY